MLVAQGQPGAGYPGLEGQQMPGWSAWMKARSPGPLDVRLDGPLAVVVGSERRRYTSAGKSGCDFLLRLPMQGRIARLTQPWQVHRPLPGLIFPGAK